MTPRALIGLLLAALALRLLVLAAVAHEPRKHYTYDSDGYDRRAVNLLRYGQLASEAAPPLTPDLDRTPVYPLFLAAIWGVAGRQPGLAALAQALLGSLTAVLAALLARELLLARGRQATEDAEPEEGRSRRLSASSVGSVATSSAALIAGLVVALDPVSAMNAGRLLTETLFTFLLAAAALLLARGVRSATEGTETTEIRSRRFSAPSVFSVANSPAALIAASALLLGLATLTRPISQALPLAMLPLLLAATWRAGRRRALLLGALFLAVSSALPLGWAARNARAAGVFTISTIGDTNLLYYRARAVLADAEGIGQDEAWDRLQAQVDSAAAAQKLSLAETLALQRQIALGIFREHPAETAAMLAKGAARMLADPGYTITCTMLDPTTTAFECHPGRSSMNEPGMLGQAASRAAAMSAAQLLALAWSATLLAATYLAALIGGWGLLRERRWLALALPLLLAGYLVALAAGAEANSRFRVPALPFIAALAGYGAARLLAWRVARGQRVAAREVTP